MGFIVHEDKSVFVPSKKLQFLGFLIDTEKMIVTLTQEKKDRLVEECQKLISKKQATIREVTRVLGLIVSSFSGVDYGQLFYREIEVEKIQALKFARGNFDLKMQISENLV